MTQDEDIKMAERTQCRKGTMQDVEFFLISHMKYDILMKTANLVRRSKRRRKETMVSNQSKKGSVSVGSDWPEDAVKSLFTFTA